jgi:hypothetical protein
LYQAQVSTHLPPPLSVFHTIVLLQYIEIAHASIPNNWIIMSSRDSVFIKHKKDANTSSVWSHFLVAKDGKSAQCKRCSSVLKTLGGSTKGLHTHLSTKHHIKQNQPSTSTSQECGEENIKPPAKRKLPDYFTKADDTLDDSLF